jgi:Ca2+-binding EF-hand superfamily protein
MSGAGRERQAHDACDLCPLAARKESREPSSAPFIVRSRSMREERASIHPEEKPVSRIPVLIASALAFAIASPAIAQPAAGAAPSESSTPNTRADVIKALDARFAKIDVNGDGNLSAAELQTVEAQVIARQKAELRQAVERSFAKLDANKDGRLTLEEYRAAAPAITAQPAGNAAEMVKLLDADKNGKLSGAEFKRRTLAIFDRLDANKDGTVTIEERRKAVVTAGR